jgi:hypothetical protein
MSQIDVESIIEKTLPNLPGWCDSVKGKRMSQLARGAEVCVELGVFGGRGLVAIALTLLDQGFGRADGVDPFTVAASLEGSNDEANDEWWSRLDYAAIEQAARDALQNLGLSPQHAQIIRLRSREAVGLYEDESVDVIHQDSNHSEEVSSEEVALWAPKIAPRGYWIFDDTNWPSTQRAQRELVSLGFTEIEDHGDWKVYQKNEKP